MGRQCELANRQRWPTPLQLGFYSSGDESVNESFLVEFRSFRECAGHLFGDIRYSSSTFDRGGIAMPITARQRRVLDYIKRYFETRREAPRIAEIGKEFGLSSSASG